MLLYFTYTLNFLLMLVVPFVLGAFLARRLGTRWGLFWAGGLTFIASQVVHLPLNSVLVPAFQANVAARLPVAWQAPAVYILLGLSAGLCEELARYFVLRYWLKNDHTWRRALMFGAGHGGIEAAIVGLFAAQFAINMFILRSGDPLSLGVPPAQIPAIEAQLSAFWNAPWFMTLLGAVERAFAICLHLSLSILVLQAFTRANKLWLLAAIGWHALVDAGTLLVLPVWGPLWTEAALGVVALISLGIVYALRQPEPPPADARPPRAPAKSKPLSKDATKEQLERTRYQ